MRRVRLCTVPREPLPDCVRLLLWDVDPERIDSARDRCFLCERVMTRGSWAAMKWLRARYSAAELAEFVRTRGAATLSPRDLAYWALITGVQTEPEAGGGRPRWLDGPRK